MKLIENIKDYIGRFRLDQGIKAQKKKGEMMPFDRMQQVGIVYNGESKEEERAVNDYANELRAEGKKVFTLGYVHQKNLPGNKKISLQSEYFWKEKLNGFNLPVKEKIGRFLDFDFDLLLNLYFEPMLPMQAISAWSSARYRVGANINGALKYVDAAIDTGAEKDLRFLIQQIDFYLKAIK